MDSSHGFVEEIVFDELKFKEVVGRGAFGVVSRATWRGIDVAVKLIETEAEKKAFLVERNQLSRVNHPNIVKLYGSSTKHPVCLVMEYAEGGSLYNVLHGSGPLPEYNSGHAMSWCLQCARGVEYLHGMKPKALIHRDLKPPNLLLIAGGTILKICDFGTACDMQTHMTNNKGSAAWMAPEVFEGSNYSEKCDVFSFGIILWEVMTRKKPFDEIGGPAFRIMWAVHNGTRPPLVKNMPKPLELLMTRCWSSRPVERPSMAEVARIMNHLFPFFKGADEPLVYPQEDQSEEEVPVIKTSAIVETPSDTTNTNPLVAPTTPIHDTVKNLGERVPIVTPTTPRNKPVVVEEESPIRTSAPPSLTASRESLNVDVRSEQDRHSADLSLLDGQLAAVSPEFVKGHRRSGSAGTSPNIKLNIPTTTAPQLQTVHTAPIPLNRETGGSGVSWPSNIPPTSAYPTADEQTRPPTVANNFPLLRFDSIDSRLQPLPPCQTSPESIEVFRQHCQLAQEYLQAQAELEVLTARSQVLTEELQRDQQKDSQLYTIEEITNLTAENEQLMMLYNNLKKQVEQITQQQRSRFGQHC